MSDDTKGYPGKRDRLIHYIRDYTAYHNQYPKYLPGKVPLAQIEVIKKLVARWWKKSGKPPRLLDYGSGKGYQYLAHRIHEAWGGVLPHCYDPGVYHLAARPEGLFDGIICTDVLEHIEQRDLKDVISDVFNYTVRPQKPQVLAPSFVYFHICCRPARKYFDDGRNLHRTIRHRDWWHELIGQVAVRQPHIKIEVTYEGEPPEELTNVDRKPGWRTAAAEDSDGAGDPHPDGGPPLPGDSQQGPADAGQGNVSDVEVSASGSTGEGSPSGT